VAAHLAERFGHRIWLCGEREVSLADPDYPLLKETLSQRTLALAKEGINPSIRKPEAVRRDYRASYLSVAV